MYVSSTHSMLICKKELLNAQYSCKVDEERSKGDTGTEERKKF